MKRSILWGLALFGLMFFASCGDDDDAIVDKQKPTVDMSMSKFQNCTEVARGGTIVFTAEAIDNVALSSYVFNIHNNFDHHNHSTEAGVEDCNLGEEKTPQNPFKFIKSYAIEGSPKVYKIVKEIAVPSDCDTGDYHFMVKVVDKAGHTTMKGLSFKVVDNASDEKPDDGAKEDPKDEEATVKFVNKIAKIHVMMHEGHLHAANFHVNGQPKGSPWRRRQDMVLVKTAEGWKQEVSEYKEEVGEGKPFAIAKAVNIEAGEMTDKNPGSRHAFEFELLDKDGNRLNEEFTQNAKNVQLFFTIDSYTDTNTNKAVTVDNSDKSFCEYVYRDTNPSNEMYKSGGQATLLDSPIGMKGYFAIKKAQLSYTMQVSIVEWIEGEKGSDLAFNKVPTGANIAIEKVAIPIDVICKNGYGDDGQAEMFSLLGKYFNMTPDEIIDIDIWGAYDPEGGKYWM